MYLAAAAKFHSLRINLHLLSKFVSRKINVRHFSNLLRHVIKVKLSVGVCLDIRWEKEIMSAVNGSWSLWSGWWHHLLSIFIKNLTGLWFKLIPYCIWKFKFQGCGWTSFTLINHRFMFRAPFYVKKLYLQQIKVSDSVKEILYKFLSKKRFCWIFFF